MIPSAWYAGLEGYPVREPFTLPAMKKAPEGSREGLGRHRRKRALAVTIAEQLELNPAMTFRVGGEARNAREPGHAPFLTWRRSADPKRIR